MTKRAAVYYREVLAGMLEQHASGFVFSYDEAYLANPALPAIAVTLPKAQRRFTSPTLFPFFYGLLAEGDNKRLQCAQLKIDEKDHFERLVQTAAHSTIGAITVRPVP